MVSTQSTRKVSMSIDRNRNGVVPAALRLGKPIERARRIGERKARAVISRLAIAYLRVTCSQFSTCDFALVTTLSIPLPQLRSLSPLVSTIRSRPDPR